MQQTLHLSLYTNQHHPTLMMAFHQPHASCSLAREYTSISWFSAKSGFPVTPSGGRRTWENGNLDSGCQLKKKNNSLQEFSNYLMQTFYYITQYLQCTEITKMHVQLEIRKHHSHNKQQVLLTHFQRLLTLRHQTHLSQRPVTKGKK